MEKFAELPEEERKEKEREREREREECKTRSELVGCQALFLLLVW